MYKILPEFGRGGILFRRDGGHLAEHGPDFGQSFRLNQYSGAPHRMMDGLTSQTMFGTREGGECLRAHALVLS